MCSGTHIDGKEVNIPTLACDACKGVLDVPAGLQCSGLISLPVKLSLLFQTGLTQVLRLNLREHT